MESIDAIKALILSLFFTGIFYLVFPIPVFRSEYWLQLFSGHISETILALVYLPKNLNYVVGRLDKYGSR